MRVKPFGPQRDIILSKSRTIGAFAGKRGGKSEIGAVKSITYQEQKPNSHFFEGGVDPYLGVVCAPTNDMLKRLSWKKFRAYAAPFIKEQRKNPSEIDWCDGSEVIGISADKPERLEGIKAGWIWIDEVFQVKEHFFTECIARVADTEGYLICTGSLGTQYINPKNHWAYKYFKEGMIEDAALFEWATADNPHFPKDEIERLKRTLDPVTFRQMFTITWDITPSSAVYSDFSNDNIYQHNYNPNLPTYVAIDWGWTHPMACGFFQYDHMRDIIYLFDEIIEQGLTIEDLFNKIKAKGYNIKEWYCDAAGDQTRENTGISNVDWFWKHHKIAFKSRRTAITYGIPIVRTYIKNGIGQRKFLIDPRCRKSIDGIKNYRYPEKNGIIIDEKPVKEDDDACDMIRYYFVNRHDERYRNNLKVISQRK